MYLLDRRQKGKKKKQGIKNDYKIREQNQVQNYQ